MSERWDENQSERDNETRIENALREGLRNLPVPETSPDFSARIHAALDQTPPWWRMLWIQMRPLLSGAACAAVVMLILLPTLTQTPATVAPDSASIASHASGRRVTIIALEAALDRPDLSAAALSGFSTRRPLSAVRAMEPPKPPSESDTPRPIPESRAPVIRRTGV
jgi:hypothetical protein